MFTCLAIAAAAVNTGNNLLYLVLALVLAALPVSWWLARGSLASLDALFLPPDEVVAGQAFDVAMRVGSTRARGAAGVLVELGGRADLVAPGPKAIGFLRQAEAHAFSLVAILPRRGDARLELRARSPFPFGLLDVSRPLGRASLVVLPAPDASWRQELSAAMEDGLPRPERGQGAEILNIRDHLSGDDARHIDWKATARLGSPMVREFARDESRRALIVVDAVRAPGGADPGAPAERAISRAAAALASMTRDGWRVALLLPDGRRTGTAGELARELARMPVAPRDAGQWWLGQAAADEALVVFRSAALSSASSSSR